jgi:hypothetical protein
MKTKRLVVVIVVLGAVILPVALISGNASVDASAVASAATESLYSALIVVGAALSTISPAMVIRA